MLPAIGEAQLTERLLDSNGVLGLDLDEVQTGEARRGRQPDPTLGAPDSQARAGRLPLRHLVLQPH